MLLKQTDLFFFSFFSSSLILLGYNNSVKWFSFLTPRLKLEGSGKSPTWGEWLDEKVQKEPW